MEYQHAKYFIFETLQAYADEPGTNFDKVDVNTMSDRELICTIGGLLAKCYELTVDTAELKRVCRTILDRAEE